MLLSRLVLPFAFSIALCSAAVHAQTGGYMASRSGYLGYLRITRTGSVVKGYLQAVYADDSTAGYAARREDITGTASGDAVMLKTGSFLGQGTHELDGDYRNGKLHLSYPTSAGQIVKLDFSPVSVDSWNAAVGRFQRQRMALQQRRIADMAVARQQWHDLLLRDQVVQNFTRALRFLNETAPALIRCEETREAAQVAVTTTEAAHKAAERAHESAQQAYETKKKRYEDTKDQRTFEANEREYADLQREYEQVGKVYDLIYPAFEKRSEAKQNLDTAQLAYNQQWQTFLQAGQQILQARRDIRTLGPTPIEFRVEAGVDAICTGESVNVYRRFADGHTALFTTLPKDTRPNIMVVDGNWYGFILDNQRLAWVKANDVNIMGIGAPSPTGRSPRRQ